MVPILLCQFFGHPVLCVMYCSCVVHVIFSFCCCLRAPEFSNKNSYDTISYGMHNLRTNAESHNHRVKHVDVNDNSFHQLHTNPVSDSAPKKKKPIKRTDEHSRPTSERQSLKGTWRGRQIRCKRHVLSLD